jgi:cell division protein FtsB
MLDFEEKRIFKKIIYSKISLIFLFILFLFIAKGVYGAYLDKKMTEENRNTALKELNELENRKNNLKLEIERLNTEEGKEQEIRDKFGLVKTGEQMIMIVDEKEKSNYSYKEDTNLWEKFLGLFKQN